MEIMAELVAWWIVFIWWYDLPENAFLEIACQIVRTRATSRIVSSSVVSTGPGSISDYRVGKTAAPAQVNN